MEFVYVTLAQDIFYLQSFFLKKKKNTRSGFYDYGYTERLITINEYKSGNYINIVLNKLRQ
jgi:hypothetical protein